MRSTACGIRLSVAEAPGLSGAYIDLRAGSRDDARPEALALYVCSSDCTAYMHWHKNYVNGYSMARLKSNVFL